MSTLIRPEHYHALLDKVRTEQAIKLIKDFFQQNLSTELRLRRVTAPLFVMQGLGINDDLNGIERPVTFPIKDLGDARAEVVHSLAKWKRLTLAEYKIKPGYGIYTDMNAIRADEELDNLHSLYVDQWDWEMVITPEQRTLSFLKQTVRRIYSAILRTEYLTCETYPGLQPFLSADIHIVHSEELLQMYPNLTAKEREDAICQKYGAVFIVGIGGSLAMVNHTMDARPTMMTGRQRPKMVALDLMATSLYGILCWGVRWNCRRWAYVLTMRLCCDNCKLEVKSIVHNYIFIGNCFRVNCLYA